VIEANEQKTIGIVQSRSLWHPSPKNVDLLPQDQIFRFYRGSRPNERSQEAKNQLEQIGHQVASLSRSFPASTLNRIFGTYSRRCASWALVDARAKQTLAAELTMKRTMGTAVLCFGLAATARRRWRRT
jgi:hypothetical protein